MSARELCVVGLGLIGGSVAQAAMHAGWTVRGATASAEDTAAAAEAGVRVEPDVAT
ncbi:MAG: prephenate dehydrogenase, partial [Actinomycetota bacterium]|nr:prephenate dehydrogenase [Actinomycetota bacterium]